MRLFRFVSARSFIFLSSVFSLRGFVFVPFVCVRVQVLLLSFSLLISPHLQPEPRSQRSHAEYATTRGLLTHTPLVTRAHWQAYTYSPPRLYPSASSRSLQLMDEAEDVPPPPPLPLPFISRGFGGLRSLNGRLGARTHLPSFHQDQRQEDDYQPQRSRNM